MPRTRKRSRKIVSHKKSTSQTNNNSNPIPKINFTEKLSNLKINIPIKNLPKNINIPVKLDKLPIKNINIQDKLKGIPIHISIPKAKLDLKKATQNIPLSKVSELKINADLLKKTKITLPKIDPNELKSSITKYVRIDKNRGVLIIDDKAIKEKLSQLFKKKSQ